MDGQAPVWLGIELLAQTIAAHGGLLAQAAGRPPRAGLFLGSRRLHLAVDRLPTGCVLRTEVVPLRPPEAALQAFEGILRPEGGEAPWIAGRLNVKVFDELPGDSA